MNILDAFKTTARSVKDYVNKTVPNGLRVDEDNMLYLINENGIASNGVQLPQGGGGGGAGGGGSTNNAILSVISTTGWTYKAISANAICVITINWSSLENELETGDGTLTLYVNGNAKMTKNISQGDFSIDVSQYLDFGNNTVKVKVTDTYENSRIISFRVNKIDFSITSIFDATIPYSSEINYSYIPTGDAVKTIHFILDGREIGTAEVSVSGRQQTYTIDKQSHGSHTFEVYFTADIEGETVESNHLYYDLICITAGETTPIIACAYNNNNITQYETVVIYYIVYSPVSLTSNIKLLVNGEQIGDALIVDRTTQEWSFSSKEYGKVKLTISCGEVFKNIELNVLESPIDIEAVTDGLELFLSSYGRSNNEINPGVWNYGDIHASFNNFNFISDGWQLDDDGVTVLRVSGDARLEIPATIFASDFRSTGKTIEVEFTAKEVLDYEAVIISCMSGGRGIQITAQRADLFSEQSNIGTQYKEEEHIRISFVIEKKNENCFLLVYINGILSGAEVYPADDDFTQAIPVGITIGSNYCTTDIYCIRVYNNSLTRHQILDNWIADTQNGAMMFDRYTRNQIYNAYGDVAIDKLPTDLPYLIIESSVLPQFKGDKKTCSGRYVDLMDSSKSFTFSNAQIDVQGTSSQYYYVKNYKIKFKNGFIDDNGTVYNNYQLNSNSVPTNVFTFKADVASSEGANNVVLAQIYNDLCPVLTPPQKEDPRVRQTIDGHPIVIFWNNGDNTTFVGRQICPR